jgi:hypothetical protein
MIYPRDVLKRGILEGGWYFKLAKQGRLTKE